MKALVAEDEPTSRFILQKMLSAYGQCDTAVDGKQAIEAFKHSWNNNDPYDIIFLDIMMPHYNGQQVLTMIRDFEQEQEISPDQAVKVCITTALGDEENTFDAHVSGCTAYFVKPLNLAKLREQLSELGLSQAGTN